MVHVVLFVRADYQGESACGNAVSADAAPFQRAGRDFPSPPHHQFDIDPSMIRDAHCIWKSVSKFLPEFISTPYTEMSDRRDAGNCCAGRDWRWLINV